MDSFVGEFVFQDEVPVASVIFRIGQGDGGLGIPVLRHVYLVGLAAHIGDRHACGEVDGNVVFAVRHRAVREVGAGSPAVFVPAARGAVIVCLVGIGGVVGIAVLAGFAAALGAAFPVGCVAVIGVAVLARSGSVLGTAVLVGRGAVSVFDCVLVRDGVLHVYDFGNDIIIIYGRGGLASDIAGAYHSGEDELIDALHGSDHFSIMQLDAGSIPGHDVRHIHGEHIGPLLFQQGCALSFTFGLLVFLLGLFLFLYLCGNNVITDFHLHAMHRYRGRRGEHVPRVNGLVPFVPIGLYHVSLGDDAVDIGGHLCGFQGKMVH